MSAVTGTSQILLDADASMLAGGKVLYSYMYNTLYRYVRI